MKGTKPTVVANWKAYVASADEAKQLVRAVSRNAALVKKINFKIAPAFPLLSAVIAATSASGVAVGAQAVSANAGGAHTGEVSAAMLRSVGATFAIVGHSERRALGETETSIQNQLHCLMEAGLSAVLCVGEQERESSGAHFTTITTQISSALSTLPPKYLPKLTIAYEPVWAIGKTANEAMKAPELQEMVIFIRKLLAEKMGKPAALKVPILYGGSVEAENVRALYDEGGVAGFLVGHASTKQELIIPLVKALAL